MALSKKYLTGFILLLIGSPGLSQDFFGDTLKLAPVQVNATHLQKYAYGQWVRNLEKSALGQMSGMSLGQALQQGTGLFVREYGSGMLASLSVRGTAAGHNALFWNGLPVNSPSLGQADYSIFAMAGFDQVAVHYGSSGALYGTDAIGGAIHLENSPGYGTGHETSSKTRLGSFGRWDQELSYRYGGDVFAVKTSVYRNIAANRFPYADWASPGTPTRVQDHAAVSQVGWAQDLAIRLDQRQSVEASFWINEVDREIQPLLGSPERNQQLDWNIRGVVDYYNRRDNASWNVKAGLVRDKMRFNQEENLTLLALLGAELDWEHSDKWQSKTGIRLTHIKGSLATYSKEEQRLELYQSTNFKPLPRLGFSLQLRQLIHDGEPVPFTPGLGAAWTIINQEDQKWELTGNISRGFKIPTLNDRFWVPGGNPDLLPEQSWSREAGLNQSLKGARLQIKNRLAYYHMAVDQWVVWLPRGTFWTPENVRKVVNQGLEYFFESEWESGTWKLGLNLDYAFTRPIIKSDDQDQSRGKRLPYVPAHKVQGQLHAGRGAFSFFIRGQKTGERFVTTDNRGTLPAFALWGGGVQYDFRFSPWLKGDMGLSVHNIFDRDYQVLRLRPMPGRNFQFNVNLVL
ncbi:iron complex outermembrane recepter protein [Cyclobacterium lianum]|uniref:Iron complex outermembrane recepter protein n=1 Tax=Cyclobacterium lianum TaxID=388280 RepID=A0A1M7P8R7_9BACT|nr:TonB-dependent receptor [Cyclobacterium lianum]SHN13124.1 iron complex outermembrane recepter protein [Cyclobacterium lianum]